MEKDWLLFSLQLKTELPHLSHTLSYSVRILFVFYILFFSIENRIAPFISHTFLFLLHHLICFFSHPIFKRGALKNLLIGTGYASCPLRKNLLKIGELGENFFVFGEKFKFLFVKTLSLLLCFGPIPSKFKLVCFAK